VTKIPTHESFGDKPKPYANPESLSGRASCSEGPFPGPPFFLQNPANQPEALALLGGQANMEYTILGNQHESRKV
jgi:hypothetical protein